jgi:Protein of unknown function (DUF2735)
MRHAIEERRTMTANLNRGSATIHEFPARGRFAQIERCDDVQAATNFFSPRVARVASSGAWYHDEAIQQAEQVRKN